MIRARTSFPSLLVEAHMRSRHHFRNFSQGFNLGFKEKRETKLGMPPILEQARRKGHRNSPPVAAESDDDQGTMGSVADAPRIPMVVAVLTTTLWFGRKTASKAAATAVNGGGSTIRSVGFVADGEGIPTVVLVSSKASRFHRDRRKKVTVARCLGTNEEDESGGDGGAFDYPCRGMAMERLWFAENSSGGGRFRHGKGKERFRERERKERRRSSS